MSSTYAGNPASFPASITIPSDGDPRDAASVNVALEALADRTANIAATGTLLAETFTANDTWTCPDGVTWAFVEGCGGGGGGGGGRDGTSATGELTRGGGGGGGAQFGRAVVAVTPGVGYAVTVGAGGTGGVSGAAPGNGVDGTASSLGALATFRGGRGGYGVATLANDTSMPLGGGAAASVTKVGNTDTVAGASSGGNGGMYNTLGRDGGDSARYAGGLGSTTVLTASGAYYPGGGGGGGGAGPQGFGGNGSSGGIANLAGTGGAGNVGIAALANTGAGGGGGGGGGCGSGGGGIGEYGGAGGSGFIRVIYGGFS